MARTQTKPEDDTEPAYGGNTVQVCCKLPGRGLLLRLHQWTEENVIGMGGMSRSVRVARPILTNQVHVRGYRGHFHANGMEPKYPVIGGYAVTTIPRDFWDEWLKQNSENPIVKSRLIWAHHENESVRDWAKEHSEVKNGREPIDPDAPSMKLNMPGKEKPLGISTADDD